MASSSTVGRTRPVSHGLLCYSGPLLLPEARYGNPEPTCHWSLLSGPLRSTPLRSLSPSLPRHLGHCHLCRRQRAVRLDRHRGLWPHPRRLVPALLASAPWHPFARHLPLRLHPPRPGGVSTLLRRLESARVSFKSQVASIQNVMAS